MSKRPRSTRGKSFTSQEISLEEKIRRFRVFENEELVREFFASFEFEAFACRYDPEHMGIQFRLGDEPREMSLLELGWRVGLHTKRKSKEAEEEAEREAANEEAGGSAEMYWNMSQGDWQVFSTWMAFEGNTCDLGSFREETDKITDLHQFHEEVLLTESRDGVAGIKRRRRDLSNGGVRDLTTASRRGRLKEDLESST
nr:hypothetical protein [Tanacetum cinerariifolium]